MKIEIPRDTLFDALSAIIGVVERRQTLPILGNVLATADENMLTLLSTDLELQLSCSVPVTVIRPGSITLPARKMFDICRGLSDGAQIALEIADGRAVLSSSGSRFTLSTLPAEEFPRLEVESDGEPLRLQQRELLRLLEKTHFAMAAQDVRYYLNGLCLHLSDRLLRAVATDGHRLALSECELSDRFEDRQVLVPRKGVQELQRLLEDTESMVELRLSASQVALEVGSIAFVCKLIDGRFPEYQRVIPDADGMQLSGDRERVRQALARAAILANEKFRGVRLQLAENELRLQTHNPEHEEAEEVVEVHYAGTPLEIGFNVTYLLDALGAMDGEEFRLNLKAADASGLLTDPSDDHTRYVVMPMRL
ncbi:MAG: DNA polymerase III subunit beta [Algiphilus sp.]|uniref:DNA polymerase III subunit beta n=1 Tax=Algiphilus sp. TaxID=1872431 RepID=UPI0032EE8EEF